MKTSNPLTLGFIASMLFGAGALAQQAHHGTVVQVEEAKGTVTVTEAPTGTTGSSAGATAQEYKLQDGLLFNALKVGDVVTFTVEEKGGVKIITNLQEK